MGPPRRGVVRRARFVYFMGMSNLIIRRYRDADHDAVWNVHNAALNAVDAHGGNGPWDDDLHAIPSVYLEAGGEFLVGELDGRVVATGAIVRRDDQTAEITRMRVHPDVWRCGFGRAILLRLEARAAELGYRHLRLETTAGQTAAQALYRAHGYHQTHRYRWRRFEVRVLEKRLDTPRRKPKNHDRPLSPQSA